MSHSNIIVILIFVTFGLSQQDAAHILDNNQQLKVTTPALAVNGQPADASAIPTASARLLAAAAKPSAPYAVDDLTSEPTTSTGTKNLIIRLLSLNQTLESNDNQMGQQARLELGGSLDALNSIIVGNISKEIDFNGQYSPAMVNISIPYLRNLTQASSQASKLLLEELLADSQYPPTFNMSAVMKDNHRFMERHPARSKPSASVISEPSTLSVPPIRRTADVVAENYTTKKIATEANIFALKLINQLNLESLGNANIIQSPFSVYQGLTLLLSGALGDTSRELDRVLLGDQSVYENTKLTHDQDRARLMASFGDVLRQLQLQSTDHWQQQQANINCTFSEDPGSSSGSAELECASSLSTKREPSSLDRINSIQYRGGTEEQHFIVANNLLFSPSAYEISNEFKHTLANYFNNTALTKMEIGSTESIQVVNSWIRQATVGQIPAIMSKRGTFDEFNVMTLLSTSWLSQEWTGSFKRIASSLRSNIRLKGQSIIRGAKASGFGARDEPLLEFVDDQKNSHFVDYIRSEPTRLIHNYHTVLNKQWVNVVVVPFLESNHRMITITPMQAPSHSPASISGNGPTTISHNYPSPLTNLTETLNTELIQQGDQLVTSTLTETSPLSKLLNSLALDPRRAMRSLWNTIAPDLITKQTILSMQMARQNNSTIIDQKVGALKSFVIPPKTRLSMPLFKIEADSTISASLNHLGVVKSFDPAQADFIGINGHPFNYNKLHLSNVIFKTTFNLNEVGINYDQTIKTLEPMRFVPQKRQKSTPQELPLESGELVNDVKLNKPFLFFIADTKSKLVLYTGIVRNPGKDNQRVQ